MEAFWKGAAVVLLTTMLGTVLDKQQRDVSLVLTICGCVLVGMVSLSYLKPVVAFLRELEQIGGFPRSTMQPLLKAVGVGITGEIVAGICSDAGKGSLGRAVQILAAAVMFSLTVPMMSWVVATIREILGGI